MATPAHLSHWTGEMIAAECSREYKAYRAAKTESYRTYFAGNAHLRARDHEYKSLDLTSALPNDCDWLADLLPESERHVHHLSGNSSQVLALGLLGVATKLDPSLKWLWNGLAPVPPATADRPSWQFEYTLAPEVLGEHPRQTSVDFLVSDPAALMCIECKWTEAGIGGCSCVDGAAKVSSCSERVLDRDSYWETAYEVFHLPERRPGEPCPLSFTYQAVRNVAAAKALSEGDQKPVFGLIYDADNPYFAGCGQWPGWRDALDATLNYNNAPVRFAAVSWQELLPLLPPHPEVMAWAADKHGLY